jgi:glycyl-tRNA synthetase
MHIRKKSKNLLTSRQEVLMNHEYGTPLGITVDFQSLKDGPITLCDRDTMTQVRAGLEQIVDAIVRLVGGTEIWSQTAARLPKV